ncbi:MAG: hypothetical protein MUC80_08720 [Candidatus Thermoplasmatota archaeon]|jgi:hypothetical protein|nr:hypothetical protein [Candidatus Thermoplasmatota archaeon]
MKNQKRTLVVFLLIISLILLAIIPSGSASGGDGNQYTYGEGNSSGYQQQDSPNTTYQMGGPGGQQGGGNNHNGTGQQGGYHQNSSEGGPQYRHRYQRRYMLMEGAENYTRLRSQCRNNATEEAFEIFFTNDNAPTFELTYIPSLNASNGQRHFSLTIEQLIEYIDINANGKYDHNDGVVSSLRMSNITFTNITYTNWTALDGKTFTIVETHTPDDLFAIILYLVSERITVSNTTITQKEIKIDFVINNYPFLNQTSQLALVTQVETPFMVTPEQNTYDEEQGTATQESGLNISSTSRSGFFTWANEANVDNTTYPVNVTVITETEQTFAGNSTETSTQTQVIFSYPRGERIIHDPKVGVVEYLGGILPAVLQSEYFSIIYLVACLVSGIVFYGIIYYRKKR